MTKSLRVLLVAVIVGAMLYAAALTLVVTGYLGRSAALIVLVVGVVLLPISFLLVRRRLWVPLSALERGIQQVADGDLTTQVPVARADELGNVTAHFNQMTRVLRDRAEEQGRFAATARGRKEVVFFSRRGRAAERRGARGQQSADGDREPRRAAARRCQAHRT